MLSKRQAPHRRACCPIRSLNCWKTRPIRPHFQQFMAADHGLPPDFPALDGVLASEVNAPAEDDDEADDIEVGAENGGGSRAPPDSHQRRERRKILRAHTVLEITGFKNRVTLWRKSRNPDDPFPAAVQLSANCIGWWSNEIYSWLDNSAHNPGKKSVNRIEKGRAHHKRGPISNVSLTTNSAPRKGCQT